jgi:hypothetical protein
MFWNALKSYPKGNEPEILKIELIVTLPTIVTTLYKDSVTVTYA